MTDDRSGQREFERFDGHEGRIRLRDRAHRAQADYVWGWIGARVFALRGARVLPRISSGCRVFRLIGAR